MSHAIPPPLDPNAWQGYLPPHLQRRAQIGYYACITHIDQQIGRLVEELHRARVANNTFFLMTSDHGEMLGDHHLWRKSYAYEGSARVPFVLRFPRGWEIPAAQVSDRVVGLQDVMPTVLDAAGVEVPETVEGRSVLPVLQESAADWRPYLHGEHAECYHPNNAMQYLTDGREKYVWFPPTGQEQLFDLTADPQELDDLAADPANQTQLKVWRDRMIRQLAGRPEGFSDGKKLLPKPFGLQRYVDAAMGGVEEPMGGQPVV